ncbi:hypothetical protein LTR62_008365 [Meristemomyces frigidus]|uniref:14-3-3 domain-containing protein n=1 Tax=Meristemomyces frigidus TaxID=1508187 RepID=A0AAN7TAZ1_9PEZI|nr:hypothetical protein LTR62_008365 [Meristemomyces frigidus]
MSPRSLESDSPPSSGRTQRGDNDRPKRSPGRSSRDGDGREHGKRRRRAGSSGLRDPIPSMTSDVSYVTNPFSGPAQTPPPLGPPPPVPSDSRRTPERPPGLARVEIPSPQGTATFLLPALNYIPIAKEHFETAQQLATKSLPPANALRLSIALEYAAFLSDCEKQPDRSVHVAARAVRAVYASKEGLDDEEFADAAELVKALALLVKRGTDQSPPHHQPSTEAPQQKNTETPLYATAPPVIDRTIAVSPRNNNNSSRRSKPRSPLDRTGAYRTPDRLSTVPEDVSAEATNSSSQTLALPDDRAPATGLGNRAARRKVSSPSSDTDKDGGRNKSMEKEKSRGKDKVAKRALLLAAEEEVRRRK